MNVEVEDLQTLETDDRGRAYLGTEYANKQVTVAVVDVATTDPPEDELAAAYTDAAESAKTIAEDWEDVTDEPCGGDADESWEGTDDE